MKQILIVLFAVLAVAVTADKDYPALFGDMRVPCISKTVEQIGCEVRASLEYLKFGAYWSLDNTNRPGFSKFFFESASEEREHAIKLIEYMNMRGAHHPGAANKIDTLKELEPLLKHAKECKIFDKLKDVCLVSFDSFTMTGAKAFECALQMEMAVTDHIKQVIKQCEVVDDNCPPTDPITKCSNNDYHVSFFDIFLIFSFLTLKIPFLVC